MLKASIENEVKFALLEQKQFIITYNMLPVDSKTFLIGCLREKAVFIGHFLEALIYVEAVNQSGSLHRVLAQLFLAWKVLPRAWGWSVSASAFFASHSWPTGISDSVLIFNFYVFKLKLLHEYEPETFHQKLKRHLLTWEKLLNRGLMEFSGFTIMIVKKRWKITLIFPQIPVLQYLQIPFLVSLKIFAGILLSNS